MYSHKRARQKLILRRILLTTITEANSKHIRSRDLSSRKKNHKKTTKQPMLKWLQQYQKMTFE